jgi:7,8-dihydro-6-hydroxymethylpterin-pyrophosphokinase
MAVKHVAVGMWTRQEQRSDLTLELHLHRDEGERWQARILDLHVL